MAIDISLFSIKDCYRTPNGYVKCKTTKLKKLDEEFHGGAGLNLKRFTDYDECPSSFIYFGLTCVNFNDGLCTGQQQKLDFCDSTSSYVLLTYFLAGSITHALNPALGPLEPGMQGKLLYPPRDLSRDDWIKEFIKRK